MGWKDAPEAKGSWRDAPEVGGSAGDASRPTGPIPGDPDYKAPPASPALDWSPSWKDPLYVNRIADFIASQGGTRDTDDGPVHAGMALGEAFGGLAPGAAGVVGSGAAKAAEELKEPAKAGAKAVGGLFSRLGASAREAGAAVTGKPAVSAEEALKAQELDRLASLRAGQDQAAKSYLDQLPALRKAQTETGARTQALAEEARRAGATAAEADEVALAHERQLVGAEDAANRLEEELLRQPRMEPPEFGGVLRAAMAKLSSRLDAERRVQSGIKDVVESAGATPRIETAGVAEKIDEILAKTNNPALERVLKTVRGRLGTAGEAGEEEIPALSLERADSLRGYVNDAIESASSGESQLGKEAAVRLREVKSALGEALESGDSRYAQALAKYRELSRPLDVIERNAGIKPLLERDPFSSEYAVEKGEVVRRLIQKARDGNPVLSRLLADSPEIKDSARMAFVQDLLGGKGPPTAFQFSAWLEKNAEPLRQLGLFDEFSSLAKVREAATRAVMEAKGHVSAAGVAAKSLGAGAREAERAVAASGRAEKAAARALEEAEAKAAKHAALNDALATATKRLEAATPKDAHVEARRAVEKMRSLKAPDGSRLLDEQTYGDLLRQIDRVETLYGKTEKARAMLKKILGYAVGGGIAYEAGKHVVGGNR